MQDFETISNIAEYADHRSPDFLIVENEAAYKPASRAPGLFKLIDLMVNKPSVWETLKAKLKNPHMSSRQIAAKCSVSHITVQNHLNEVAAISPELARLCGVSRKKMKSAPGKISKKMREAI